LQNGHDLGTAVMRLYYSRRFACDVLKSGKRVSSPHNPDRPWGPPSLLATGNRRLFPGDKASGTWSWPLTESSAEVKNDWGLYRHWAISRASYIHLPLSQISSI